MTPCVPQAATTCTSGCNHAHLRLSPHAPQAATLCITGDAAHLRRPLVTAAAHHCARPRHRHMARLPRPATHVRRAAANVVTTRVHQWRSYRVTAPPSCPPPIYLPHLPPSPRWDVGLRLAFSRPWVTQRRNMHSLLGDFNAEVPLYQQVGPYIEHIYVMHTHMHTHAHAHTHT